MDPESTSDAEERPAKCRADAFSLLRAALAKYRADGYDIWHVLANSRPECLRVLERLNHDSPMAALAKIPVRRGRGEFVMVSPSV